MRLALCVMIALCALSVSAYATAIYTDESTFLSAIAPGYYLEQFSTFSDGDPLGGDPSPLTYDSPTVNGYSWTVSAANGLWSLPLEMSAAYPYEALVITFTGAPVTAVGGTFAATDYAGDPIEGASVIVSLADGTTQTVIGSGFVGFTTASPIASLHITPVEDPMATEANWAAFTHLYAGASQPEPSSILAVLIGLVGMGSAAGRRRLRR